MQRACSWPLGTICASALAAAAGAQSTATPTAIGREVAIARHLEDGEEFREPLTYLMDSGRSLFTANWTIQEGQGRPFLKGTGQWLSDPGSPLVFPRNMNRLSGPEANSCAGCHNAPVAGGAGDIVGNVFVLGQRFDFATFDPLDVLPTRGTLDERGKTSDALRFANSRATPGMFGAGYYEMLAREITVDLRAIALSIAPGHSAVLMSKGISFGTLVRNADGTWNTSAVVGLPPQALATNGNSPPSLVLQPWSQAGGVISLRQFTNNAFLQHHGMEPEERVGIGVDADGDGLVNELTRADITAAVLFQAAMAVPGRVVPKDPTVRAAILHGEHLFSTIGCAGCHIPSLPLKNWMYTEPSPYNPAGNLQVGQAPALTMDLTAQHLPEPRLRPINGNRTTINVPLYSDFKLHDICNGPSDPNVEVLNQNEPAGSDGFFAGNRRFLTRRLWDIGSKPNHYHHGRYTTIRESILAHAGEATAAERGFAGLSVYDQGSIIEFLKSLKVLPPGTRALAVDEDGNPVQWPPK